MPTSASKSPSSISLPRAIETFARAFSFTRSFTHPYSADRVGPLWHLHDFPPRRNGGRTEEWIINGSSPEEAEGIIRNHALGRYALCDIVKNDRVAADRRAAFKSLGYRLGRTEPFMVHPLKRIPTFKSPAIIMRVTTQPLADLLTKAARSRQILPEHLVPDAPIRQYIALIDGRPVGWVRSISAASCTYCSNMFVFPPFRRRGIARALLSQMLHDDRAAGSKAATLLASHTGAQLYPVVGYQPMAMLYLYTPKKR